MSPLFYFFFALTVVGFAVEAWAFIDALTRPKAAYPAAGKLTKTIWLLILGVALVVGAFAVYSGSLIGFLSVAAFVAAAVYLVDVRPKVKEMGGKRGGSGYGPYGPW
jgi:hypothetical protein